MVEGDAKHPYVKFNATFVKILHYADRTINITGR